ncbi:MAG: hypothetical protein AAGB16_10275 [Pseudomonadota bacterium]
MRSLALIILMSGMTLPALAQSAEETEKAVDCLALTTVANENRSIPDTAQIRQWREVLETSTYCKTPEQGVEHRIDEYRGALREADEATALALKLMIESEAEKCVSGAATTRYEEGI